MVTDGQNRAEMVLSVEINSANLGSVYFVLTNDAGQAVANAEVVMVSQQTFTVQYGDGRSSTYQNIFRARSDARGIATLADAPIGLYDYQISAAGHESARGTVSVMPQSKAQPVQVELVAVPLQIKWTVEPIVIEDTYDITLKLTFAADVPKPKFAFLPPWVALPHDIQAGFTDQVIVLNPSLIELHNVTVKVVGAQGITVSSGGQLGTLAPNPRRSLPITSSLAITPTCTPPRRTS